MDVFAEAGSSFQQVGGTCPAGWVVMQGERPSPHHVAQADGEWVERPLTAEDYRVAVQQHLDELAQDYGYDSIASAVTYADEPAVPKFQAEGVAFRAWRSLVWAYCYAQLDAVANGDRAQPSIGELIAELPALNL